MVPFYCSAMYFEKVFLAWKFIFQKWHLLIIFVPIIQLAPGGNAEILFFGLVGSVLKDPPFPGYSRNTETSEDFGPFQQKQWQTEIGPDNTSSSSFLALNNFQSWSWIFLNLLPSKTNVPQLHTWWDLKTTRLFLFQKNDSFFVRAGLTKTKKTPSFSIETSGVSHPVKLMIALQSWRTFASKARTLVGARKNPWVTDGLQNSKGVISHWTLWFSRKF